MKLVVDTNIIISALIKAGATRKIIFDRTFELITPSFTISEINKYREEICKKAEISIKELN